LAEALGIKVGVGGSVNNSFLKRMWRKVMNETTEKYMDKGFTYVEAQFKAEREILAKTQEIETKNNKKGNK